MTAEADRAPAAAEEAAALARAERFVEQEEGATNRIGGLAGHILTALAVIMSLVHLYAAYDIVSPPVLRALHVGFTLFLCFLLYPVARRFRHRIMPWDLVLAAASVAVIWYLLAGGDDLTDRATLPNRTDTIFGITLILLVLEACRRSTGPVMPVVVLGFLAYALLGPYLPAPWTHRGYDLARIAGHMYMTLEGIFGVAIDVSSTLIILFTIYGAVLQVTGAGKFFIDFSFSAMGGKSSGAGRTIVLASFLLGGPSGSGVATTVTLGSVAYPMLARAGYEKNAAGGLLAAGGMGAILSPPVLGAAAFLIAEFLKISYLDVILMSIIPTCLFYFSLLIMVEIDARKYDMANIPMVPRESLLRLTRQSGFHFLSLVAIVGFMVWGFTPILAVFWATVIAGVVSFLNRDSALVPRKLIRALEQGSVGMLNVAATCAAAGIIVGVVTLTGLGLKFSAIVIDYAGGSLVLTTIYTALIVWIIGLAMPVTASYIICAVIAAPALTKLGVPDFAAHMFIFYYAVLSEVSPPTALSPFAAAAITGGGPYRTTLQSWKYTMPAFVVPFAFVLDPLGVGLLLKMPKDASVWSIVLITAQTAIGIVALAAGFQRWLLRRASLAESALLVAAGLLLVMPLVIDAVLPDALQIEGRTLAALGLALLLGMIGWQRLRAA